MTDPYDDQLAAARYRAERDQARQECERLRARLRDSVPRDAYKRRRATWLRHIAECETALGRRREIISELSHRASDLTREIAQMRPRLMPEGMSWPVFEDGEPVRIGDVVSDVEVRSVVFRDGGILLSDCTSVPGWGTWRSYKEPIKRPELKVYDANGAEIRVGDTVWDVISGIEFTVAGLPRSGEYQSVKLRLDDGAVTGLDPDRLTHRAPVLAADGRPLREGDKPYRVDNGKQVEVRRVDPDYGEECVYVGVDRLAYWLRPGQLTHTKPEPLDTWERIVRCRDCRRSFEECGDLWCRGIVGPPIEPEGFCAWGEPREGE